MPSRRIQRLNEQLKREISQVIRREVRDPRVGIVTVTDVDVTSDLTMARVYVRPMGDGPDRSEALEGLRAAAPHIRHQLGRTLRIRRVPELHFEHDETLERAMRIESILEEVRPEGGWDERADPGEEDGEGDPA
ncbi:MAG: 30S ribosome-binding factor RbfA [Gemmatimonadota bacterium]|jgi:ribosome-binding factor A